MDIIACAFDIERAVKAFCNRVRVFYYKVVLAGFICPECNGKLSMIAEGLCRCDRCKKEFDPTTEFQNCSYCGGVAKIKQSRYFCSDCGSVIISKFLFYGRVYDRQYFAEKMAKSREKKKLKKEKIKQEMIDQRSGVLETVISDFSGISDIFAAIDDLAKGVKPDIKLPQTDQFDIHRYESHLQSHIREFGVNLRDIPPLHENKRKDLIWRFIAAIFLAHAGIIEITQDGFDIILRKNETYRKRQGISGEIEDADGFKRSVSEIET